MIKIDNIINNSKSDLETQITLFNESSAAARLYYDTSKQTVLTVVYQNLNESSEFNNDIIVLFSKENGVQENVTPDDVLRVAERSLRFAK
ncbi:hypothetical protein [Jeotgalicoccus marinus]|uniref:hypothetical protein n=1 Tax=Jeotgalicoccus marinus TaxID=516700 RepID=UPI00040CA26A|nr:hypothetical protein [Jeotgalicoccus marinus]